ncbi:MAG: CGNR zinc finger domain-containing protein [Anaerolineales bacterium]
MPSVQNAGGSFVFECFPGFAICVVVLSSSATLFVVRRSSIPTDSTVTSCTSWRPQDARRALDRVIELREALYRIFSHSAAGTQIPNEDLASFNAALGEALHRVRLDASRDGFSWGWSDDNQNLEAMLWPILWKSAELLTSEDLKRVGECADDRGCGYLFYDNSRNHSRRWCSMESCGNRAKVQRHYQRSKTQDENLDGG